MDDVDIEYIDGDATYPRRGGNRIIVHVCNDQGGWGSGFVVSLSLRWQQPEAQYRQWYGNRVCFDQSLEGSPWPVAVPFELGCSQLVRVEEDACVINMIAQHKYGPASDGPYIRYEALEECLLQVAYRCNPNDDSVHMPRIGCGYAGGRWEEVEPIVQRTLIAVGIPVVVYDFVPRR